MCNIAPLVSFFFFFFTTLYQGLSQQQEYFQQKTDYNIQVNLDDQKHLLEVDLEMTYTNQSPQELSSIIMHLWANAYGDKGSDFGNQMNNFGNRSFYFAKEDELGGYQDVNFYIGDASLTYENFEGHVDIIKLKLPQILKSGESIRINCSYYLKIPANFSRLGRSIDSYQICQWFPKPAVFDHDGWHPFPYLHLGEFYSEFGNYKVEISIPSEYVVASTGQLKTESELIRYNEMAKLKSDYCCPSREVKTLLFEAEGVHDFAFFLDKNWLIEKEVYRKDNNADIDCWSFYRPDNKDAWEGSAKYVKNSIEFLSKHVGEYTYPQATAVDGDLSVGGGMEYPMVTIIGDVGEGKNVNNVIAHEVFHNWFYGMIASNERDFPFLDEGPTSYYEGRYMDHYYPQDSTKNAILPTNHSERSESAMSYIFEARRGMDQPSNLHSNQYDEMGYGISAYTKPQSAFQLLEAYYSKGKVDQAFQLYYQKFANKHVGPYDLLKCLELVLDDDLNWWYDQVIGSSEISDYCIHHAKRNGDSITLTIKNNGKVASPIILGDDENNLYKVEGHTGKRKVTVHAKSKSESWTIDPNTKTLDLNNHNDTYFSHRLLPKIEPLKLRFLPGFPAKDKTDIYLYPVLGWNQYDHWMAGLHINNFGLLPRNWNYQLTPMYSFAENELSGHGKIYYNHFFRDKGRRMIQMGVESQKYNFKNVAETNDAMSYIRFSPFITFKWHGDRVKQIHHDLHFKAERVWEERAEYIGSEFAGTKFEKFDRYYMAYQYGRHGALHPYHINTGLEYSNYQFDKDSPENQYVRFTASAEVDLYYNEHSRVFVRGFFGVFLYNDQRESNSINNGLTRRSLGLSYSNYIDFYEETFLGRNATDGLLSRQVALKEGGFKTAFTSPFASGIGSSNDFIASVNISADLPGEFLVWKLLQPFFDIGYFSDAGSISKSPEFKDQLIWSSGLTLNLMSGIVQFHMPIFNSTNVNDALEMAGQKNPWERISFTLNLKPDKVYNILENTRFNL